MPLKGRRGRLEWLAWLPRISSPAVHLVQALARRKTTATRVRSSSADAHEWLSRDACVDVDAIFGRIEEKPNDRDHSPAPRTRKPD